MQSENKAASHASQRHLLTSHDPFWPRIDLAQLRKHLGVSQVISDARLEVAAQTASNTVAKEFAQWRRVLRARGYKRLEDLVSDRRLSYCYWRAIEVNACLALENQLQIVEYQSRRVGEQAHE